MRILRLTEWVLNFNQKKPHIGCGTVKLKSVGNIDF